MAQKKKNSSNSYRRNTSSRRNVKAPQDSFNEELINEIILIVVFALAVLLFLCNFRILGSFGNAVSDFMFGVFGISQYILPIVAGYLIFFGFANQGNSRAARRVISIMLLVLMVSIVAQMISNMPDINDSVNFKAIYEFSKVNHKGGGIIAGLLTYFSVKYLGTVGTVLLVIVLTIICIVILTEKSFFSGVKTVSSRSKSALTKGAEDFSNGYEKRKIHRDENRRNREDRVNEKKLKKEIKETDRFLNLKEANGSPIIKFVPEEDIHKERDDIHEINLKDFSEEEINLSEEIKSSPVIVEDDIVPVGQIRFHGIDEDAPEPLPKKSIFAEGDHTPTNGGRTFGTASGTASELAPTSSSARKPKPAKPYKKPSLELLKKGVNGKTGDKNELMSTARKLEEVLESFNVKARVTDVSQGPAVTRYEMIPETGVKVSKILSLSDDIKLNLAAADIRIEAPIPGKAAIGIEVPNKESSSVALRDLLDSKEFKASESRLSFAVGKDIAGKIVVTDIAKMPHMLIAGATGSGKSVCINTLIMSILYKALPTEVKMIMIDPKVVELSVYNGIPHLLIPVVTDPKKANASLAWAVKEMDDRYRKFAELGVRDLKGYNEKIKGEVDENNEPIPEMFQLVVIVDELADLMMVAGKEVEESICRLAQLARAAGIHLIIATQRPSVDVITGLIKANMPSRIAFSVSSGVDSRTILDMVGAEKLLGKGDMLFYPQGYTKPARVQGAFVSDKEVSDVVAFLKDNGNQELSEVEKINNEISNMSSGKTSGNSEVSGSSDSDFDEYFYEAGKLITESGKSSIGMLQRKFKIGFNRAARIMDALAEAGVVGPEEGTKPRQILMSPEQFEEMMGN